MTTQSIKCQAQALGEQRALGARPGDMLGKQPRVEMWEWAGSPAVIQCLGLFLEAVSPLFQPLVFDVLSLILNAA